MTGECVSHHPKYRPTYRAEAYYEGDLTITMSNVLGKLQSELDSQTGGGLPVDPTKVYVSLDSEDDYSRISMPTLTFTFLFACSDEHYEKICLKHTETLDEYKVWRKRYADKIAAHEAKEKAALENRKALEAARLAKAKERKALLAKLTPTERKLLGV